MPRHSALLINLYYQLILKIEHLQFMNNGDEMTEIEQTNLKINRSLAMAITSTHLELILLPTEACNFRCSYCYEDYEIGRMPSNIINAIKALISERVKDLKSFNLSWFGGEPMLAKDIIIDISKHAKAECEKHGVFFVRGEITTNGYSLNLSTLKSLVALNQVNFQISLDGFGKAHDLTRKMISGRGTFEKIWQNLLAMQKSSYDFSVMLRLHLTPSNLISIETLISHINSTLLSDSRFKVMFKPIGDFGGSSTGRIATLDKSLEQDIIRKFKEQLHTEVRESETVVAMDSYYICYAAKPNSLLIRANGNIGKCTVALSDPRNNIGHINDDGTLSLDNDILKPWLRGYKEKDFNVLGCPLNGLPKQPQNEAIITLTRPPQKTPVIQSQINSRVVG